MLIVEVLSLDHLFNLSRCYSSAHGNNLISLSVFTNFLQLGLFLKKLLRGDLGGLSKSEFVEAITQYLGQRSGLVSNDLSKFCICGGKGGEAVQRSSSHSSVHEELINIQQKQLEVSTQRSISCK